MNKLVMETGKKVPGATPEETAKFAEAIDAEIKKNGTDETYRHLIALFVKKNLYSGLTYDSNNHLEYYLRQVPKDRRDITAQMLKVVFKTYNQQRLAENNANIPQGSNLSRRNVATTRLAPLMGIGDMIAESRTAVIKKDGKLITGNLMEDAGGVDKNTVFMKSCYCSPEAEDQLLILQVFDLLCGQIDRHFGNFLYVMDPSPENENRIAGIKCIDNDMSFGRLSFKEVKEGRNRLRPLSYGALHALPPKFKNRILAMDGALMKLILRDLLEPEELDCLEERLEGLKKELKDAEAYYASLSAEGDKEARDPEIIKLSYFNHLRQMAAVRSQKTRIDLITNFLPSLIPQPVTIEARIKQRKKQLKAKK